MNKTQKISLIIAGIVVILDILFLRSSRSFYFILGIGAFIGVFPTLLGLIVESKEEKKKEEMFLEFVRDIVESVNTGLPISKGIINLARKNYGILSEGIKKLANQVEFGIPLKTAFRTFAKDTNDKVIARAVELIIQAEISGGEISAVLGSVAKNISELEELKKERQSRVYNMLVQGYILFFLFIVIMLFVDLKFIPMISGTISPTTGGEFGFAGVGVSNSTETIKNAFFILLLVQAFFAGLTIGKLAEGKIRSGVKHSLILLVLTYLLVTGARMILAPGI